MADGHHHVFAGNEVFVLEIGRMIGDFGATGSGELVADFFQFRADDVAHAIARPQNIEIVLDLCP